MTQDDCSQQTCTMGMASAHSLTPLARRRATPQPCREDRLTRLLLDITVWRLLSVAGSPFKRIIAWYLFTGRSLWMLVVDVQRWLWRAAGWLSAPPRSRSLHSFGRPAFDFRRWHYGLGEHRTLRSLGTSFITCVEQTAGRAFLMWPALIDCCVSRVLARGSRTGTAFANQACYVSLTCHIGAGSLDRGSAGRGCSTRLSVPAFS